VPDCYLGLRLDADDDAEAGGVLVVAPAALLHPAVPAAGWHRAVRAADRPPDRTPQELVFLADLTVELRAWPADTWAKVGVDPQAAAPLGGGRLAARRPVGPAAGWADRPGDAGVGAAGHDLCAPSSATGPAANSPTRPGGSGTPPAAAAPATGSCSRGPRRLRQCPSRTPTAVFGSSGGPRTLAASSSAADRKPARRPPSRRPDGTARRRPFRTHPGHPGSVRRRQPVPLPQSAEGVDGRWPAAAVSRPCSGLRRWTRLVDTGSHRRPGAADTPDGGSVVQPLGNATVDSRQHNPSTATPRCPTRSGTARCCSGQHRHSLTARSVA
jgi:hypothetical protein